MLKGHCGVKGLLKTIADLRCIACATGFLSTGPTVVGRAWSGNTAVPNVNFQPGESKGLQVLHFPVCVPAHPTVLSLAFLCIARTHPLGLREPTSSKT